MRQIIYLFYIAILPAIFSCTSGMKVTVDALNMPAFRTTYLYSAENLQKKKETVVSSTEKISNKLQSSKSALLNFIDSPNVTANLVDTTGFGKMKRDILDKTNSTMNRLALFKVSFSNPDAKSNVDNMNLATPLNFTNTIQDVDSTMNYLKKVARELPSPATQNTVEANSQEIEIIKSTFGESMLNDPLSSVVSALPKQYWHRYKSGVDLSANGSLTTTSNSGNYSKKFPNRFNFTRAGTLIGNSDIAIKMTTPGEFIVKGVRVDADEAVRNSFKVVSQGIKYIAYASGIPVSDGANNPQKSINPLLDSLGKMPHQYEAAKAKTSADTDAFLQVLIDASTDLNTPTPRNGQSAEEIKTLATERVKRAYAIYKAGLSK